MSFFAVFPEGDRFKVAIAIILSVLVICLTIVALGVSSSYQLGAIVVVLAFVLIIASLFLGFSGAKRLSIVTVVISVIILTFILVLSAISHGWNERWSVESGISEWIYYNKQPAFRDFFLSPMKNDPHGLDIVVAGFSEVGVVDDKRVSSTLADNRWEEAFEIVKQLPNVDELYGRYDFGVYRVLENSDLRRHGRMQEIAEEQNATIVVTGEVTSSGETTLYFLLNDNRISVPVEVVARLPIGFTFRYSGISTNSHASEMEKVLNFSIDHVVRFLESIESFDVEVSNQDWADMRLQLETLVDEYHENSPRNSSYLAVLLVWQGTACEFDDSCSREEELEHFTEAKNVVDQTNDETHIHTRVYTSLAESYLNLAAEEQNAASVAKTLDDVYELLTAVRIEQSTDLQKIIIRSLWSRYFTQQARIDATEGEVDFCSTLSLALANATTASDMLAGTDLGDKDEQVAQGYVDDANLQLNQAAEQAGYSCQ